MEKHPIPAYKGNDPYIFISYRLALNVHAVYESNFRDEKDITLENILPGFNKYELFRRSNMACALHIQYKLWPFGLEYVKAGANSEEKEKTISAGAADESTEIFSLPSEIKNELVQIEHRRWVAFQRAEGWRSAMVEQTETYMATGASDKHRHPIAKLHPCICGFDRLPAMCEKFDPKFIEYDESFIEKLPFILEGRWGITGDRYKIVKREGV